MPGQDDRAIDPSSYREHEPEDYYEPAIPASESYKSIRERFSVKNRERMDKPHTVDRVKVPLPSDLDPRIRIDLKNKRTGEIGFQLVKAGNTRSKRMQFLIGEIEGASEMTFPPLTHIDRAMFPGEERSHIRPQVPMPNFKTRRKITLADLVANVILKQTDWIMALNTGEYIHLWDNPHPVWAEWTKTPSQDPIWVLSIRKTLPDRFGKSHFIPELEFRFE